MFYEFFFRVCAYPDFANTYYCVTVKGNSKSHAEGCAAKLLKDACYSDTFDHDIIIQCVMSIERPYMLSDHADSFVKVQLLERVDLI